MHLGTVDLPTDATSCVGTTRTLSGFSIILAPFSHIDFAFAYFCPEKFEEISKFQIDLEKCCHAGSGLSGPIYIR